MRLGISGKSTSLCIPAAGGLRAFSTAGKKNKTARSTQVDTETIRSHLLKGQNVLMYERLKYDYAKSSSFGGGK